MTSIRVWSALGFGVLLGLIIPLYWAVAYRIPHLYITRNQEVGRNCLSQCHGKVWIKTYIEGDLLKCICEDKK